MESANEFDRKSGSQWSVLPWAPGLRIQQVKFLAWLEAKSLAWRDGDFRAGPRIAANPCLTWAHIEYPETSELNPVARSQSFFQAFENRVDSSFRLIAR